MNKQPFYHRAVVLFTCTTADCDSMPMSCEELTSLLQSALRKLPGHRRGKEHNIIIESLLVEECDAEPGDPHDLMG